MNPAAPFGISVSEAMLDATTALLQSIGFATTRPAADGEGSDGEVIVFIGPSTSVGVAEIAVAVTAAATSTHIVRLAVADPLGVWCAWHLDGVAVAESDIDQFLHEPAAGLIVRANDANRYELTPLAADALHSRAMFVDADPSMLTEIVTAYCHDFAFRPINAEPFHHDRQMTLLQRGGPQRMTLGLLTPNETLAATADPLFSNTSSPSPSSSPSSKAEQR